MNTTTTNTETLAPLPKLSSTQQRDLLQAARAVSPKWFEQASSQIAAQVIKIAAMPDGDEEEEVA